MASEAGPQIGDKARVSGRLQGDHVGHIREVPREGDSPSTYIDQVQWAQID
jgi:hypothetical protein